MPVLLPGDLLPWMMRRNILPSLPEGSVAKYWRHMKDLGSPIGNMSTGEHIPMYVWGDGAQYTESGESMLVFSCGIIVDEKRTNIFPLFLCREVPWQIIGGRGFKQT